MRQDSLPLLPLVAHLWPPRHNRWVPQGCVQRYRGPQERIFKAGDESSSSSPHTRTDQSLNLFMDFFFFNIATYLLKLFFESFLDDKTLIIV